MRCFILGGVFILSIASLSVESFAQVRMSEPCSIFFESEELSFHVRVADSVSTYEEALSRITESEAQMIAKVQKMSLSELVGESQKSIDALLQTQTYLPGCTPQWTTSRVEDLVGTFLSTDPSGSMLHQVSTNLASVKMLFPILKRYSGILQKKHRDLLQLWDSHAWHYQVFRELEARLAGH